jgi:hypothetical protein
MTKVLILCSSVYLNRALEIYCSPINKEYRKGEMARTNYKLSLVLKLDLQFDEAETKNTEAEKLRKEYLKEDWRPATGEESYDSLVNLWTR